MVIHGDRCKYRGDIDDYIHDIRSIITQFYHSVTKLFIVLFERRDLYFQNSKDLIWGKVGESGQISMLMQSGILYQQSVQMYNVCVCFITNMQENIIASIWVSF